MENEAVVRAATPPVENTPRGVARRMTLGKLGGAGRVVADVQVETVAVRPKPQVGRLRVGVDEPTTAEATPRIEGRRPDVQGGPVPHVPDGGTGHLDEA